MPQRERRKFKRIAVNFVVSYEKIDPLQAQMAIGEKKTYAAILDLSENGMAILTNEDIPVNSLFNIKFSLVDQSASAKEHLKHIEILGEVRYNMVRKDKTYRVGIYFKEISPENKKIIAEFCQKIL